MSNTERKVKKDIQKRRLSVKHIELYLDAYFQTKGVITGIGTIEAYYKCASLFILKDDDGKEWTAGIEDLKPILRPLTDMREDEAKHIVGLLREELGDDRVWENEVIRNEFGQINTRPFYHYLTVAGEESTTSDLNWSIGSPHIWRYMLSCNFDLFHLIDAGLAVDATDVNQIIYHPYFSEPYKIDSDSKDY